MEKDKLKRLFEELKSKWEKETAGISSTQKFMNFAYQRIIGLSMEVVPLIIQDLIEKPKDWFWALKAITGEDPVESQNEGIVPRMAEDWINFARKKGWVTPLQRITYLVTCNPDYAQPMFEVQGQLMNAEATLHLLGLYPGRTCRVIVEVFNI